MQLNEIITIPFQKIKENTNEVLNLINKLKCSKLKIKINRIDGSFERRVMTKKNFVTYIYQLKKSESGIIKSFEISCIEEKEDIY